MSEAASRDSRRKRSRKRTSFVSSREEELEGDHASKVDLLGEVDLTHPATCKQAFEPVTERVAPTGFAGDPAIVRPLNRPYPSVGAERPAEKGWRRVTRRLSFAPAELGGEGGQGRFRLMRVLVIGSGGVGAAVAAVAKRRGFFERMTFADVSLERAQAVAARERRRRASPPSSVDASDASGIAELIALERADAVLNAVDPRFNPPIFDGRPRRRLHVPRHGDDALARRIPSGRTRSPGSSSATSSSRTTRPGATAAGSRSSGSASSPASPTSSPATRPTTSSREIDEVGVRDGADLVVDGYDFAPTFSIWTTIEECLNPPVIWESERGWYTTEPFSEPETFVFPEGSARSSA